MLIANKVTIGIRPQHITFAKESEEYFEGRIDIAEMMGSETYLHIWLLIIILLLLFQKVKMYISERIKVEKKSN